MARHPYHFRSSLKGPAAARWVTGPLAWSGRRCLCVCVRVSFGSADMDGFDLSP